MDLTGLFRIMIIFGYAHVCVLAVKPPENVQLNILVVAGILIVPGFLGLILRRLTHLHVTLNTTTALCAKIARDTENIVGDTDSKGKKPLAIYVPSTGKKE
jgi:hypothetical protein